jgi:ribosomal protein S18 acetylase RimI-like enzyme
MLCKYCKKAAVYKCRVCGSLLCAGHTKLGTMCASHAQKLDFTYTICKVASERGRSVIRDLVKRFWGEEEQLTFDKKYVVTKLPAYAAKTNNRFIGFISFASVAHALVVVALGVLPRYQWSGVGNGLMEKVESEAKRLGKKEILVSTSNDDLPALAFYQLLGFQIFEVKPNVIAEKHGTVLQGIGGLPVRDELRLQKKLI